MSKVVSDFINIRLMWRKSAYSDWASLKYSVLKILLAEWCKTFTEMCRELKNHVGVTNTSDLTSMPDSSALPTNSQSPEF